MVTCLYHAFPSFNCRLCVAYLRVAIINKGPLVTVMIRGMRRPDNARWNKCLGQQQLGRAFSN